MVWYQNVTRDQKHQRLLGVTSRTSLEQFTFKYTGKGMLRSQLSWLQNYQGDLTVNDIYRIEDLQQAFHDICSFRVPATSTCVTGQANVSI